MNNFSKSQIKDLNSKGFLFNQEFSKNKWLASKPTMENDVQIGSTSIMLGTDGICLFININDWIDRKKSFEPSNNIKVQDFDTLLDLI